MAKDVNKVMFTGRLGADPDMRFTPQGTPVTTFRVASNRSWTGADGERHEEAEWFHAVAWNKLAEICNDYLAKGTRVYVEGRSQTRSWTDDEGATRYKTEIVVNDMIILEGRRDRDQAAAPDVEQAESTQERMGVVHVSMRGAKPKRSVPTVKFESRETYPVTDEDLPF
jgi:single-strand DNA-binding protein